MRLIEPQLFVRDTCDLGEGPFWFENRLWWVDVHVGRLHSVDPQGGDRQSSSLGTRLGAAVPLGDNSFLVAVEKGIGIFDRGTGGLKLLVSPEENIPGSRFNDGKCDPVGRFLAGTLNMEGRSKASGLYSLGETGTTTKLLSEVTISNGLAWSADGATLHYIDSPTREIAAFDYDILTGSVDNRRSVVDVPAVMGYPDGMEIDVEDRLWVGHWDGWAVRCWSAVTGECPVKIPIPCSQVTSCCFGGANLDQLFITTAREGLSARQLRDQPLAGSVFVCRPGTSGFPTRSASDTISAKAR